MRIALAQLNPTVGALAKNSEKIVRAIESARERGADLVLFPEMALVGYPPEDLLMLPSFVEAVEKALKPIIEASKGIAVVVGTVRPNTGEGEKGLLNTAALIEDRDLVGFQDKTLLPDYDVFSERRYFSPASRSDVWSLCGKRVAVTLCEDIWQHAEAVEHAFYPHDPVCTLKEQQPDLLLNLSASPFYIGRLQTRLAVCREVATSLSCPVIMCNQVGGNDSLIFDGFSLALDKSGGLIAHAPRFEESLTYVDLGEPGTQTYTTTVEEELTSALTLGIRDYFHKQGFDKACFGLSGGIDSALTAHLAVRALGKENVHALILPSRYSPPQSFSDAQAIVDQLGISATTLSIEGPFQALLDLLEEPFAGLPADHTEENIQARIRGVLLMAFSNKHGYLVLGTGNKSEMALGYTTLYGDMCGGLGVLSDVTKEQVYALSRYLGLPKSILDKPPSAELRPDQLDTDALPPYPTVDTILRAYVEEHQAPEKIARVHNLDLPLVQKLVHKIHLNEYKRRQAPPGLRVTKKSFTAGRRFPIVQGWNL